MRHLLFVLLIVGMQAAAEPATNVILVTADGLRWQEVFRGPDEQLLNHKDFTPKNYEHFKPHQRIGVEAARAALMPFFWSTLVRQGSVIGDRDRNSLMRVSNPWWFSYPGYNELLTGKVDPAIDSNDKKLNPNVTVLEWLNRQPSFKGRVQAFGSWDAFPYIINAQRSGIPVNVGPQPIVGKPTQHEQWLQHMQQRMPLAFPTVRHDAFTHEHALEAMRSDSPRVVYISYGETDDFAHEGKYGDYLDAAHRFDGFLRELWEFVQSDRDYSNRTTLLITTDHGRGEQPLENWQHHSSAQATRRQDPESNGIAGSEQIWFAAIGSGIKSQGLIVERTELMQTQTAATVLLSLGIAPNQFDPSAAPPLKSLFE